MKTEDVTPHPGLIVSRLECCTHREGGEWGWSLYLWYGGGPKRLLFKGAMA